VCTKQRIAISSLLVILFYTNQVGAQSSTEAELELQLEQINQGLYRFSTADRSGVLLVGEQSIAVGDPLDATAASALDALIKAEFNLPVRYVFYSRFTADRIAGAKVFTEQGATVVAHANALHAADLKTETLVQPDILFEKVLTLNLGGESLELMHLGSSLTTDTILARFPNQDAVFAGDMVSVESLPTLNIEQAHFPAWFGTLDKLVRYKFSYLIPGQGKIGIRSDAKEFSRFLRELYTRVKKGLEAGQSEEDILSNVTMQRYHQWQHFDEALQVNVQGMITALQQEQ